jgi:hypothetical protein
MSMSKCMQAQGLERLQDVRQLTQSFSRAEEDAKWDLAGATLGVPDCPVGHSQERARVLLWASAGIVPALTAAPDCITTDSLQRGLFAVKPPASANAVFLITGSDKTLRNCTLNLSPGHAIVLGGHCSYITLENVTINGALRIHGAAGAATVQCCISEWRGCGVHARAPHHTLACVSERRGCGVHARALHFTLVSYWRCVVTRMRARCRLHLACMHAHCRLTLCVHACTLQDDVVQASLGPCCARARPASSALAQNAYCAPRAACSCMLASHCATLPAAARQRCSERDMVRMHAGGAVVCCGSHVMHACRGCGGVLRQPCYACMHAGGAVVCCGSHVMHACMQGVWWCAAARTPRCGCRG